MFGILKKYYTRVNQSARPQVCNDIASWAINRGIFIRTIGSNVLVEVDPCIASNSQIKSEYYKLEQLLKRDQKLLCIENAVIRDEIGFVELTDGQLCLEGNWYLQNIMDHPAYQRRFNYKKRFLKGNWYSLLSLWSPMYYHWFHDVLPRLENAVEHLPSDTRFLINKSPFEYQLKSLEAYGISPERLEYQTPQLHTKVEHLWFATPVGHEKFGSTTTILKAVNRIKKHFGIVVNHELGKKIYISRKNAISRRVQNEYEVCKIALSKGYNVSCTDEIPWLEQVDLFNNSISILGPHGGGLTNMIFSNQKMNIYEIDPPNHSWPYYQLLSAQLENSFIRVNAKTDSDGNRANIYADLDDIGNKVN